MKTGLTTHAIRVWERRYEIIKPERTESNRRLYTEQEVEKLLLLKRATQAGHSISQLAKMDTKTIKELVREQPVVRSRRPATVKVSGKQKPQDYVDQALDTVRRFNTQDLENILMEASVNLSQPVLVDQVVIPLLHQVGEEWFNGDVRVAQEHSASATLRTFLGRFLDSIITSEDAPLLVTATVSGLFHEFGALLAAISAASQGWNAKYLGPNLPPEEIVYAVREMNAKAVLISIVFPPSDKAVEHQIENLGKLIPEEVPLLVGGRAVMSYTQVLDNVNAVILKDMADLRQELRMLRG